MAQVIEDFGYKYEFSMNTTAVVLTMPHKHSKMYPSRNYCSLIKGGNPMNVKLFDSELKVMGVLWREGDSTAKHISDVLKEETGWNMNTTYTLIKRCIKKGAIERSEPHFMCHALIPKEEVQEAETNELINKIYDGSVDKLFAALLGSKKLSAGQIERLKQIASELE